MKTVILITGNLLFVIPTCEPCNATTFWLAINTSLLLLQTTFSGMTLLRSSRGEKNNKSEIPSETNVNKTLSKERNSHECKMIPEEESDAEEEPDDKGQSANDDVPLPVKEQSSLENVPLTAKEQTQSLDAPLPAKEQTTSENGHASKEQSQSLEIPLRAKEQTKSLDVLPATCEMPAAPKITIPTHHYNFSSSSICLLPTFCVYSSEGEDITARFQPRLRKILVALIVYSVKDKKGISVEDFTDKFWKDMDKAQRSNNRNVNISNLRKLLKLVGNVKIINKDGFLRIDFGSGVKCDYLTGMKLLHRYNACGDDGDVKFMECITELLNRGPLVTEMSFDWLDESKNDYSSNSLDMLLRMLQSGTGRVTESDVTRIARLMFMHEPTSEKALAACCAVFIKHDKRSIAKNVFLRFCEDFLDTMGEPYGKTFAEFISNIQYTMHYA
jgi:DNA-binding SARP family transcriptional activator